VNRASALARRALRGFAMFWWDFLVGDTPELFVAALVTIGAVAWISQVVHSNAGAIITLLVLAIGALALSLWRAQRGAKPRRP